MKKRLLFVVSAVLLSMVMNLTAVQSVLAAGKVSYTYTKVNASKSYSYGEFKNYFKYPKLKGPSSGIKKINKYLKKEGEEHVKVNGSSSSEISELLKNMYMSSHTKATFYNTVNGTAAFNNGKVFSIKYVRNWFLGRVSNQDTIGDTFDVKTGKRLTNSFPIYGTIYP